MSVLDYLRRPTVLPKVETPGARWQLVSDDGKPFCDPMGLTEAASYVARYWCHFKIKMTIAMVPDDRS